MRCIRDEGVRVVQLMFTRIFVSLFVIVVTPFVHATDLNRAMILMPPTGTTPEDVAISTWQHRVAAPTASVNDYEQLGWAYVAKARRTLDAGFYKLAEATADVMDATFPSTPEAALLRGHVYHNLHRFHEAETIARRLVADRGLPEDWALLSDALMEQGKLAGAIDALQQMVNRKPGAEADTRIAHLRWLKGDLRGAIAAMSNALRETSPRDATTAAWMLSRLSGYYLQAGNSERADELARAAMLRVPDYAPALLAAGRTSLAMHRASDAVTLLSKAEKLNPLPEYQWWLADAERATGDEKAAVAAEAALRASGETADPRTFALYLATRRTDTATAVRLARAELQQRGDVLSHDTLAWSLFAQGDLAAAEAESRRALAEKTGDPRLLLHAAVIAQARGRDDDARSLAIECRVAAASLLPSERALLGELVFADETSHTEDIGGAAPRVSPGRSNAGPPARHARATPNHTGGTLVPRQTFSSITHNENTHP